MPLVGGALGVVSPLAARVARILDEERVAQGITQVRLARSAEVSQSQLSKMLRAERNINLTQLERLCIALGLRLAEVVREASA